MGKILAIGMVIFTTATIAADQPAVSNSSKSEKEKKATTIKKETSHPFSFTSTLSAATSLKELDAPSDYVTTALNLNLNYKLNSKTSAQAFLGMSKELTNARKQSFTSSFVGINRSLLKNDFLSLSGKARAYFPVNKSSRRNTTFRGRLYTAVTAGIPLGFKNLGMSASVSLAKNFHEFTYTSAGTNNTSLFSTLSLGFNYQLKDNLGLSLYASSTNGWDYDYFNRSNTFALGQSIAYTASKNFIISAGHENGGNVFGYDGKELEVDLIDKDSSSLFTSLTYTKSF